MSSRKYIVDEKCPGALADYGGEQKYLDHMARNHKLIAVRERLFSPGMGAIYYWEEARKRSADELDAIATNTAKKAARMRHAMRAPAQPPLPPAHTKW